MRSRFAVGILSLMGLLSVFLFQQTDIASMLDISDEAIVRHIFNRAARFLFNDFFTLGLIYALFAERKYLLFALWVQLVGVVLFLIPYFVLKIYLPGYHGPLLSFLHRVIVNPILLLLLIPAFYWQRQNQIH